MQNKGYNYRDNNLKNKKSKTMFHISIIILIIIITFGICFYIYLVDANDGWSLSLNLKNSSSVTSATTKIVDNQTETTTEASTAIPTTTAATTASVMANPVPENNTPKDFSYFDECAFIGDSLTVGFGSYGFIPEKNVLASVGMNLDKINTATIPTAQGDVTTITALTNLNPKYVYIMLGSNGIAWMTNEKMVKEIKELVDQIDSKLPDSIVYILSIPPVTAEKEIDPKGAIKNEDIDIYNSELLKLANENTIAFVDINTQLKGNDGKLVKEYAGKDGMHFQRDTYSKILDYILSHTREKSILN